MMPGGQAETTRRAYLQAMGYQVWLPRQAAASAAQLSADAGLLLTGGQGTTLLICDNEAQSTGLLAADLLRYLGGGVQWAWPVQGAGEASLGLEQAIGRHLLTEVVIFGTAAAQQLQAPLTDGVLHSARITVAPDLDELAVSGLARQALWKKLPKPASSAAA